MQIKYSYSVRWTEGYKSVYTNKGEHLFTTVEGEFWFLQSLNELYVNPEFIVIRLEDSLNDDGDVTYQWNIFEAASGDLQSTDSLIESLWANKKDAHFGSDSDKTINVEGEFDEGMDEESIF